MMAIVKGVTRLFRYLGRFASDCMRKRTSDSLKSALEAQHAPSTRFSRDVNVCGKSVSQCTMQLLVLVKRELA